MTEVGLFKPALMRGVPKKSMWKRTAKGPAQGANMQVSSRSAGGKAGNSTRILALRRFVPGYRNWAASCSPSVAASCSGRFALARLPGPSRNDTARI